MLGNGAFSKEEVERLLKAPNILADFFKRSAELGWTVAAEQIRSTYWEIETHATRLRRMAKGWQSAEMGMVQVGKQAEDVLNKAADELDRLAKFSVRRPISELRQEAFGKGRDSGPDRWVIVWWRGGDLGNDTPWKWSCALAGLRHGSWQTIEGRKIDPTHFSEMPTDDPSVL